MKSRDSLISKFFTLLFFALPLFSCATKSNSDKLNEGFKEKYGQQIEQIQSNRLPPLQDNKQVTISVPPTEEEVAHSIAKDYYPYVDIAKFGEKVPQNYLPSAEVYEKSQGKNLTNSLPVNIFEVTYNATLHPPFQKIGAEFDIIKIPEADAYGVKTAMSDKSYLLAGGGALQKTIDAINADKNSQDAEISEILISEKKQLARKKKMTKMLDGQDQVELAMLEKSKKVEAKSKEKSEAKPYQAEVQQNSGFTIKTIK